MSVAFPVSRVAEHNPVNFLTEGNIAADAVTGGPAIQLCRQTEGAIGGIKLSRMPRIPRWVGKRPALGLEISS